MTARFVWYDLNTKDLAAAAAFYTELFGWTLTDWVPPGAPEDTPAYRMITLGEQPIGGMVELGDAVPAPAHWLGHIAVPDVDAAVDRARRLGAQFPAGTMDVPTVGRFAPMLDKEGCAASLFTPASTEPMGTPEPGTPGYVGWNELAVADPDGAKAFYSEVVGWEWDAAPMEGMNYYFFGSGERGGQAGGMMRRPEGMPASCWMVYFTVTSADDTTARVRALGGHVLMEPFDIPGVGRLAVLTATDGSAFAIGEWKMAG